MRAQELMDPEYHRRRAEVEMEQALRSPKPEEALIHLELARIHREKRDELAMARRARPALERPTICGTDKESRTGRRTCPRGCLPPWPRPHS